MTPFRRQPEPPFWAAREQKWHDHARDWRTTDPLNKWRHQQRSLAWWFHELVREASEPRMCAYCDGSLLEQSRETIDHFLPVHEFRELALSWENLFPARDRCNSTYKRERWSCRLVRPDTDPVGELFDFDDDSGWLRPRASLDWPTRVNVRLTIRVFRLNERHRCEARKRVIKEMRSASKLRDDATLEQCATKGPYRFVARRVLQALRPLDPSADGTPPA